MSIEELVKVSKDGKRVTLQVGLDLTAAAVPELRQMLKDLVTSGARDLIFDLSQVSMIDSSGIGLLVATHNSLSRLEGSLTVVNLSHDQLELLKAFRLDRHFSVLGSAEK
jgi:anti-anti-sigma factor